MNQKNRTAPSLRCTIYALAFSITVTACTADRTTSYLRPDDHIVFIGDSITEGGIYGTMVQRALTATYPQSALKAASAGSGGKTAAAGPGLLRHYLSKAKPTIAAIMFGVNDTGWSAAGADAKATQFKAHLQTMIDICKEQNIQIVFVRSSHFSHSAAPDAWVDGINGTLYKLFDAQNELAREHGVPVIDAHAAYTNELRRAWVQDPAYEFTPDVVHPLEPGSAAMAGAILRAFGIGLPLAGETRGPFNAAAATAPGLTVINGQGVADETNSISIAVRTGAGTSAPTRLKCTVGTWSGESDASDPTRVQLPVIDLPGRSACMPLLMSCFGKQGLSSGYDHFFYSKIRNLSEEYYRPFSNEYRRLHGPTTDNCPISELEVTATPNRIIVSFKWRDSSIVPAKAGFKNRFGTEIDTPLDLKARPGDQPCDAVEILLDLRDAASLARYTSSSDGIPDGVERIGIYLKDPTRRGQGITFQASSEDYERRIGLSSRIDDTRVIEVRPAKPVEHFGFAILITDAADFKKPHATYYLGGDHPLDPAGFIRMGARTGGVFWRIGY